MRWQMSDQVDLSWFHTMEASYCLCGQPYDPNIFMIQCDVCKDWFHGSCTNFQEHTAIEVDKYHCPRCTPLYGPSQYKPHKNYHRHDYWDDNAVNKPVQTGTEVFIKELRARHFHLDTEVVSHMRGQQLTETLLTQKGFDNPIVIDGKDGLDMTLPPDNFSLYDVESYIGGDFEMDVIDVTRQMDIKMKLRDFVAYFNSVNRSRIFNVVSLEFSKTGLSNMVEAPLVARQLDWVNTVWPREYPLEKPHVQKYCLMSVKNSYTDFHIDFGGTSVWYHILHGEKIFYFIKPTPANMTLYQQWMTSSNQSETFFGDQVDQCFKCVLRQGQTMMIPTGWIHAVLTPTDSLVFGGNFLHSLNIRMQLQVYDIEKKIKTASKFLYPFFETINWFAVQKLLEQITELNAEERKCPATLLQGIKTLVQYLKQWNTDKDPTVYNAYSKEQIPVGLNVSKLFKDISKEVRHAERYINSLNPPKPERESKRKRKKPVNKDFVDYSLSKASLEFMTADNLPDNPKTAPPIKLTIPKPATYPYSRQAVIAPEVLTSMNNQRLWGADMPTVAETTTVHRGGTVLKIKFGTKDIIPVDGSTNLKLADMMLPEMSTIYDFHDDSEREEDCFNLSIDESPRTNQRKHEGQKMKLSSWTMLKKEPDPKVPKNGIESLLKASALTGIKIENENTGRTSPSTQEAIAGMLSISQTYIQPGKKSRKKGLTDLSDDDDDDDLGNVHQDEDYIYPALDNSDDDEDHIFKRGRSKIDEPWNPKARVGPLLPKMNRPAREGTKKQAVEKVLEAAAKRTHNESPDKSPKRQYRRKKVKTKAVLENKILLAQPSTSTAILPILTPPSTLVKPVKSPSTAPSTSTVTTPTRPRKGMKTAKQRLGKILKIHKMMH